MRGERLTIRYRGNPAGVTVLIGLLRQRGLKVSHGIGLGLPLQGVHWSVQRDIVEAYGTVLDVKGRGNPRDEALSAIDEFNLRHPETAEIELAA